MCARCGREAEGVTELVEGAFDLAEGGFDRWVEALCEPHYCQGQGRPSVPPGTYFRMLLVGYFEGINSQRGIAWRVAGA